MNKAIDNVIDKTVNGNKNKEIINVKEFFKEFSDTLFFTSLQQIIPKPIGDGEGETNETRKLLEKLFKKAYKDNVIKEIMNAKAYSFRKLPKALIKKDIILSMRDLIKSKQFYVKNKIYVPENEVLQLYLLQQYHNSPIHSHPGYKAMYQKI